MYLKYYPFCEFVLLTSVVKIMELYITARRLRGKGCYKSRLNPLFKEMPVPSQEYELFSIRLRFWIFLRVPYLFVTWLCHDNISKHSTYIKTLHSGGEREINLSVLYIYMYIHLQSFCFHFYFKFKFYIFTVLSHKNAKLRIWKTTYFEI